MMNSFGPWATAMAPGPRLSTFWKRRMAMLATISSTPPRSGRGQRARLSLLLGLLVAVPTVFAVGPPAAAPAPQPPPGRPAPGLPDVPGGEPQPGPRVPAVPGAPGADVGQAPTEPPPWQVFHELQKAYALPAGELVRCVPAPFPPIRATWLRSYAHRPLGESQVLTWQGNRLELYDRLPQDANGFPLRKLLGMPFHVPTWDVVDEQSVLAGHKVSADFVIAQDGWDDARALDQLAIILRRDLNIPVKLSLRQVERPHVVASGSFHFATLPGTNYTPPVAIYGKEPTPPGTPVQDRSLYDLLVALGDYVGLAVVDELAPEQFGSPRGFPGGLGGRPHPVNGGGVLAPHMPSRLGDLAILRFVVRGDRASEGADVESVLKRVSEQTGLTLKVESRKVRTMVVEKAE
jgi:hypothetical protein